MEQPLEDGRITREERIQTAPVGERTPLLEQERRDERKEAHGFDSRWTGDSVRQERKQVHEHPGRGSPDVVLAIRHRVVTTLAALPEDAVALVVRRIEQELQGHFEYLGHLEFVRPQLARRGPEGHPPGYALARLPGVLLGAPPLPTPD